MQSERPRRKKAAIVAIVVVASAATVYGAAIRPRLLVARQLDNHACSQGIDSQLHEKFGTAGRYPASLRGFAARGQSQSGFPLDAWGHAFFYQSDGRSFLLVSYGRDGKADGSDYLALRGVGDHPAGYSICGDYDADEVMSDLGWHRLCGK